MMGAGLLYAMWVYLIGKVGVTRTAFGLLVAADRATSIL